MKSPLQLQAEEVAEKFSARARKPLVIEFAGVPKAGKTSTLAHVQAFLKRCGFHVEVIVERASVCPIRDKTHANFNVWTACTTLAQVLEKTQDPPRQDDPDILFLDRGLFDSICWLTMMKHLSRIREDDRQKIEQFLLIDEWKKRISAVFVMLASPDDAMRRERGVLPVEERTGSIMNREVLQKIRETNVECADRLSSDFQIHRIDTSTGENKDNPKRTAEEVAGVVLGLVEDQIQEDILSVSKDRVKEVFSGDHFLESDRAGQLIRLFDEPFDLRPRDTVEEDPSRVQAIPIVIIRNASGNVLRLRRREKSPDRILNDKNVIWAGGHVRREDARNGDPLILCAERELQEELRLQVEADSLSLIGAIYFDNGGGTSRHVAIAYEWRAPTDDVSITISRTEFHERRGASHSGSFVSVDDLVEDVDAGKFEPWSSALVREYLARGSSALNPLLF